MRKKILSGIIILTLMISGCTVNQKKEVFEPSESQIRQICELATLECYYHNVARSVKEKGTGLVHWTEKDRKFWIEYTGYATIGIEMSEVKMTIEDDKVIVYLPDAVVLDIGIVPGSYDEDSYYIENGKGNKITADDQIAAISEAQKAMEAQVKGDKMLLISAREQAMKLISNYIEQLGKASDIEYTIVFTDSHGNEETVDKQNSDVYETE